MAGRGNIPPQVTTKDAKFQMTNYEDLPLDAEIKVKLPASMKRDFQIACIKSDIDMSTVIREAISTFLAKSE